MHTAELDYLANPVSVHFRTAEMHIQAANSLAPTYARATLTTTEVLSMLSAMHFHVMHSAPRHFRRPYAMSTSRASVAPRAWSYSLKRTRPVYEFVRVKLGVRMYGAENAGIFSNGIGMAAPSIGENVSKICGAIRDGEVWSVVVGLFA
ncbi:hypothetical protein PENSPDRAFT_648358 [Peniophora sp. CONT]|nr:hypothetical protein PENSPDRAFT_648358 [Peniophora sp. CONT]